jgi:dTDP-4-amino-4,6-dideoxygalactose transaminase
MAITFDDNIRMVDLHTQYCRLKEEIDAAIQEVLNSHAYINGPQVTTFANHLADYLNIPHVIPCANGTDAIQIALMALQLQAGDEVIVPAFNYVAATEATALLGMTPVLVDVNPDTFNIDAQKIEQAISRRTKAIIAVHLFGQSCDMEPILRIAEKYNLSVIEDNAQSIGAVYTFASGETKKAGTIGQIGTTSFFPSKPLACYGDGGALITSGDELSERIRMIANHGQDIKYRHKYIGCNSRLDTIQAAILNVKLKYISELTKTRIKVAKQYNEAFKCLPYIITPYKAPFSTHVYHQYTIRVQGEKRNDLQSYLRQKGIPSMVYYPIPMDMQEAFRMHARKTDNLSVARQLSESVLSLPIHSEMRDDMQEYIIEHVKRFFKITG